MVAILIDSSGVRPLADPAELSRRRGEAQFLWLDLFAAHDPAAAQYLTALGLDAPDAARALRFGQTGRMQIGRDHIRAVTWIGDPSGDLVEVHLGGWGHTLLTVWNGAPEALDEVRHLFAERIAGHDGGMFHSAAMLLQLLTGTLSHPLQGIDLALDDLRLHIDGGPGAPDFAALARRLQRLQTIAANFDRYAGAARSATVGVETAPGVNERAAAELNDYVEQAEDVAEQFYERRRWMSDLMHDYSAAIAQRQGEQINRLTIVSLIFLPLSAVTGFFGMNFDWLNKQLDSREAFLVWGVALPMAGVLGTTLWLWRRGLIRFAPQRRPSLARAPAMDSQMSRMTPTEPLAPTAPPRRG